MSRRVIKIDRNGKQKVFFTSDLHLGHKNIVKGTTTWKTDAVRDFETVEEHDRYIINEINNAVGPNDILFILGDVFFKGLKKRDRGGVKYINQINCRNLYLIYGNHDGVIEDDPSFQGNFIQCSHYLELRVRDKEVIYDFVLSHYSMRSWNKAHYGSIMLYGHSHNMLEDYIDIHGFRRKTMDVGVDTNNYKPYSLDEVLTIMNQRQVPILDKRLKK